MTTDPVELTLFSGPDDVRAVRAEAFRILQRGEAAAPADVAAAAGVSIERTREVFDSFAAQGVARLDDEGRVVVIGGLSLRPTGHRMRLGETDVFTCCAIDAVGIPAGLQGDAVIETACAHCGRGIRIEVHGGRARPGPEVAWLPQKEATNVLDEWCPEMNLFCDAEHLAAWQRAAGDPKGRALGLGELESLGRDWWGWSRDTPVEG